MTDGLYAFYAVVALGCIFLSGKPSKRWAAGIAAFFMANSVIMFALKDAGAPVLLEILAEWPFHLYGFICLQFALCLLAVNAPKPLVFIAASSVFIHLGGFVFSGMDVSEYLPLYNGLIYIANLVFMAALIGTSDAISNRYIWIIDTFSAVLGRLSNYKGSL